MGLNDWIQKQEEKFGVDIPFVGGDLSSPTSQTMKDMLQEQFARTQAAITGDEIMPVAPTMTSPGMDLNGAQEASSSAWVSVILEKAKSRGYKEVI